MNISLEIGKMELDNLHLASLCSRGRMGNVLSFGFYIRLAENNVATKFPIFKQRIT